MILVETDLIQFSVDYVKVLKLAQNQLCGLHNDSSETR